MQQTERLYKINQLLESRRAVSFAALLEALEVSPATVKRDLAHLRDRLHAPIVFDREAGGYRLERSSPTVGGQYELPGLWFSAQEIHALLTMQHLLSNLDSGGLLGPYIQPLLSRLSTLLGSADNSADEVCRRIHVRTVGSRGFDLVHFQVVGSALLRRHRLRIEYHARGSDEITLREVSPQRLVHYRDNWYLDAWCHLRNDLRAFSVDAIRRAEMLDKGALDVSERRLNQVLGASYGIFRRDRVEWAMLRFSSERARWVATEHWHDQQKARYLPDGSYELQVPYADDRELVMDILKYGADCEVLAPASLRSRVRHEARRLAELYR